MDGRKTRTRQVRTHKVLKRVAVLGCLLFVVSYSVAWLGVPKLSMMTHGEVDLNFGNVPVPSERTREWAGRSAMLDSVVAGLAGRQRGRLEFGTKGVDHLLCQLAAGRNVEAVNQVLQEAQPWGKVGSGHDYDFALCGLTVMLYHFGERPELLYPETVDHIVWTLMTEKGGEQAENPDARGLLSMRDTENHVLMTEGSRFLTNQWIAESGNKDPEYDNTRNGQEAWLLGYLKGLERAGIHEYNSIPYEGYTLRALLNLASFGKGPVAESSRRILDRMTWDFALGSLSLRRYAPFRRQPGRAGETRLDCHYQTAMMKGWMSLAGVEGLEVRNAERHAMWVGLTGYRPPDVVVDWALSKPGDYFVRIGHGGDGSPEIYSGGPGYLISAGGEAGDLLRYCVARPTTLMLEDGADELKQLLHLSGLGSDYRRWNHTGVHRRFAVAAGPVWVPDGWSPVIKRDGWLFYERAGKRIAVFSTGQFGLFCLMREEGDFAGEAARLVAENGDAEELKRVFRWPDGPVLSYDVAAKKSEWVMVSVDGNALDRAHGKWPLMQGELPAEPQ